MKHLDIIGPGVFIILLSLFTYLAVGKIGPLVIGGASAGGFLLYLKTGYKYRFDTSKVIVAYLLTVILGMMNNNADYFTT